MDDKIIKGLFIILMVTAFTSDVVIAGPSFNLNLSQIVSVALFILLTIYSLINRKKFPVLHKDHTSLFIYLYFLSNLFSSLFFAPNKSFSLKGSLIVLSYVMIYVTTRWSLKFLHDKNKIVKGLVNYNMLMAVVGLLCMITAFVTGAENFGVSYGHLAQSGVDTLRSPIPSIKSLSVEPNLFAIITAVVFCLTLSGYLFWKKTN